MPAPIEIWTVDLARATTPLLSLDAALGVSSPDDRAAVQRLQDRESGRQRLAMRVAVRLLAERYTDASQRGRPFTVTPAGKPTLADRACHFSLSHVRDLGLVAISRAPVGIDLEGLREPAIDAGRRRTIETAAAALSAQPLPACDARRRLLQAWTRLEALAKADGAGIGRLLTEIGALGRTRPDDHDTGDAATGATHVRLAAGLAVWDLELGADHLGAVAGDAGAGPPSAARPLPYQESTLRSLIRAPA